MRNNIIGVCCILPIIVIGIIWFASNKPANQADPASSENLELQGEKISILGREHVPEGTKVATYNSSPPTSGNHWPQPANWGLYTEKLPDEQLVHNLEHGGIWISYKDTKAIDEETGKKLESFVSTYPQAVIITERPENDAQFTIASWGRLLKLEVFDEERVEKFIRANINNAPEPLAGLEQMKVSVGSPFPEFSAQEVGGGIINNDSLKGKPAIVWFTTTWCTPCQIGARMVAQLEKELGGNALNVIVFFVDPRESESNLLEWRTQFANPHWHIAFDNGLAEKLGIQFLDSKYLLNQDGVKNFDTQIVNQQYLDLIKSLIK